MRQTAVVSPKKGGEIVATFAAMFVNAFMRLFYDAQNVTNGDPFDIPPI